MILADDIADARGTINDMLGFFTSMHDAIQKSQRFVLHDDLGIAAYKLVKSRPSSLLAAMPICRLPHKSTWIEWTGGIAARAGWQTYPAIERGKEGLLKRVNPIRMGCLVEALDDSLQRGQMTWAWLHPTEGMNGSALSVNFDWTEDGNVESAARAAGVDTADEITRLMFHRYVARPAGLSEEMIRDAFEAHGGWETLKNNRKEFDAFAELIRHEAIWISRHGRQMIETVLSDPDPAYIGRVLSAWEGDISGEAPFIDCLLMMMNSRNAVDYEFNDLSRLNRARDKRGQQPFLDHSTIKLHMSKGRLAAIAARKADARGTDVEGHFKIRKSGVWWWNDHWRGDRQNPMPGSSHDA